MCGFVHLLFCFSLITYNLRFTIKLNLRVVRVYNSLYTVQYLWDNNFALSEATARRSLQRSEPHQRFVDSVCCVLLRWFASYLNLSSEEQRPQTHAC